MATKLYVGNLTFKASDEDLKELFYDLANDPKKRIKVRKASSYWREQFKSGKYRPGLAPYKWE